MRNCNASSVETLLLLQHTNIPHHPRCSLRYAHHSVIVVLFVFASGLALDEKLASFWKFTHTIEAWGLTVRGSLFVLTILMMIIGLSLTSLRNDYYEALIWHDESVFFVSAGYILGCLFAATRPKSNSWWQKNFPNVAPVNFLVLGIYAVWSGNRFWGSGEILLGVVGLIIRPMVLNARKLTANLAPVDLDEHLSSSLMSSFIIIPSILQTLNKRLENDKNYIRSVASLGLAYEAHENPQDYWCKILVHNNYKL